MKTESLNALLIDRELGELTPETLELLESWLAQHPEQARDVTKLQQTLGIARTTVQRFPELGRADSNIVSFGRTSMLVPLALAAGFVLMVGAASWAGFKIGRGSAEARSPIESKPSPTQVADRSGPWAQYALASSPQGGLTVVRKNH